MVTETGKQRVEESVSEIFISLITYIYEMCGAVGLEI